MTCTIYRLVSIKLSAELLHMYYCVVGTKSEVPDAQEKKLKVADILSRNVNAYQKLSFYVEPVLGI